MLSAIKTCHFKATQPDHTGFTLQCAVSSTMIFHESQITCQNGCLRNLYVIIRCSPYTYNALFTGRKGIDSMLAVYYRQLCIICRRLTNVGSVSISFSILPAQLHPDLRSATLTTSIVRACTGTGST